MKKVLRYLQDQALEASNQKYSGSSYLAPTTKEPQQRAKHHSPSHNKEQHNAYHQERSAHPSSAAHSFPAHTAAGTSTPPNPQRDASPLRLSDKIQRGITRHQYAQDNILQSYELYIPELDHKHLADPQGDKYWIIYIHGGYFRDPAVTSSSFHPALELLASGNHHNLHYPHLFKHSNGVSPSRHEDISPYIAGYASVNYRLSPHKDKAPQDPAKTSVYELRDAKWPDHMHDVLAAIAHMQAKYRFGDKYLLVGHSVGATMAVLSALAGHAAPFSRTQGVEKLPKIEPPTAVLGVSGIYDFPLLHESFPDYFGLTRNAIPNEADDALASPARYTAKEFSESWTAATDGKESKRKTKALVIAHSRDDGLVDWRQVEAMHAVFGEGKQAAPDISVKFVELKGLHADIFEKGTELARAIAEAVGVVRTLEESQQS